MTILADRCLVFVCLILFCGNLGAVEEASLQKPPTLSKYERWVARYSRLKPNGSDSHLGTNVKLVVVCVEGETESGNDSGVSITGNELTTDGFISGFSFSEFGAKGGSGGSPISVIDLKKLEMLLSQLPADGSRLPPAGRRLLLQARTSKGVITRVYDRAIAAQVVWDVLRLAKFYVPAWCLRFSPVSEITARAWFQGGGVFFTSGDGSTSVFTPDAGNLQVWRLETKTLIRTYTMSWFYRNSGAFSSDGAIFALAGGDCLCFASNSTNILARLREPGNYLKSPQFTPDGRFLILQRDGLPVSVFDTKNWTKVEWLPDIPDNAVQYIPSPKNALAVCRLKTGEIILWNIRKRKRIAMLGKDYFVTQAAFCKDESRVAIATALTSNRIGFWGEPHLGIWETMKGLLKHELRPLEPVMHLE